MRNLKILSGLTVVVITVLWLSFRSGQEVDLTGDSIKDEVGKEASAIFAMDKGGKNVSLDSFRGKPIVLNFWATWCPPCIEELPSFLKFAEWAQKTKGAVVVAVSEDESWEVIEKVFREKKFWPDLRLPLTILLDKDGRAAEGYGSKKFPETFVIGKNFKIVRKFVGAQDWTSEEMKKWINENL